MSSRRRAPKRLVLSKVRTGAYPQIVWEHGLECGHIEKRKREAPAVRIGCTACLNRMVDNEAGVYVAPDLDRERLRQEGRIRELIRGSDFGIKSMNVNVEDVDGQAQVTTIRLELERVR